MAVPQKVPEQILGKPTSIAGTVCDWAGYRVIIDTIRKATPADDAQILYRGQRQSSWTLSTTLERATRFDATQTLQDYYQTVVGISKQIQSVTGRSWPFQPYAKESNPNVLNVSNLEYLTYLRHHGFPSPLLDWTRSPYVAAFFAFCDADERGADSVAVFVLADWKTRVDFDGAARIFRTGDFVVTDKRHYTQQSDYTIAYRSNWKRTEHAPPRDLLLPHEQVCDDSVSFPGHGTHITKIEIPARERTKAMAYFADHNINRHTLYGDEDSFIKALADAEFLSH